jgi:transposase
MLRPMAIEPVPPETARVARAAFPKGHRYLRLADELETLFRDETFVTLFPSHGQPALPPWHVAFVTLLQFAEGLSDRQAVNAVQNRIDWTYVLRLELTDPGFDVSVLSEFRIRLITGAAESLLFDMLLRWCRDRQLWLHGTAMAGMPRTLFDTIRWPAKGGDAPVPKAVSLWKKSCRTRRDEWEWTNAYTSQSADGEERHLSTA